MEMIKTHYFIRLLARSMDILFIGLLVRISETVFPSLQTNLLVWFILYNVIVAVLQGKTLGKASFSLSVTSRHKGIGLVASLIAREFLLLLLLPFLLINIICTTPQPLHDRISGTKVIKDES